MLKRLLSAVSLMILMSATAHAAARSPQVPVSGTALATFFASQGQTIDVNNQQLDLQTISLPMTTSFDGADPTSLGFYDQGSTGPFYTQDARNPGGEAKILAYNGTGSLIGWTWFACETGAGPGGDYADLIALVNLSLAPTPVLQTNWGTLKRRFR